MKPGSRHILSLTLCLPLLAACGGVDAPKGEAKYPTGADRGAVGQDVYSQPDSVFGGDGLTLFGGNKREERISPSGMAINSYLWRASLETVSFMPLSSADPFGGVIITDWYEPPETKGERFKANVFIMGRELRTNALQVKLFRQVRESGGWKDAESSPQAREKLEDTILTRARAMRVDALGTLNIED